MNFDREKPSGSLVGVRVLDFCSFINGAYSAALMGDLGAEVIKIESLYGDLARAWGPFVKGESRFALGVLLSLGALIRMLCEEHMVKQSYPEYREYSKATKRMIPYVF